MVRVGAASVLALLIMSCGGTITGTGTAGVPAGETVSVAGWDVRTVDSRTGRSSKIESGIQRYDIQVSAWFSGNGTTTFDTDVAISAQAKSRTLYTPMVADCPNGLAVDQPVRPDQSIEGFVCFEVDPNDVTGLQLVLTPTDKDSEPTFLNTITPTALNPDDFGPEEVVAELLGQGVDARLVASPYGRLGFLTRSSSQHVLCLDDQESILYEYANETLRETDSNTILPTGGFENGHFDLLYGRVMWWAKGRVIVNYNFADSKYWDALSTVLGETLSPNGEVYGDPPDPLPPSDTCS